MLTLGFVLGVDGSGGASGGGSTLGSGTVSSWLGSVRLVVGVGRVVIGTSVDGSGSAVITGSWVGPES